MKLYKFTGRLDHVGMTASVLCAVHCALIPLLLTTLPLWGLGFLAEGWVELVMIGIALIVGVFSLGMSFKKHHRSYLPLFLLAVGFALIFCGHFVGTEALEPVLIPAGGITIAAAHFVNWRFTRCRFSEKADAGRIWSPEND